jgi:hypothetical protein
MSLDLTSVNREWKNPMMQQHISEIVIQKLFKLLNCFLCSISNFLNKKKTIASQYLSSFKLFGNKRDSSIHDSPMLNRVTSSNERVYMILKAVIRLNHPAYMEIAVI